MKPEQLIASLDRRDFFKLAAAGVASLSSANIAETADAAPTGLIDTNINLSHWPLRRLPCDDTAGLVAKLRANGVTQAWAGSFDGLRRQGNVLSDSPLSQDSTIFRYTLGANVILTRGFRLKLSAEYYDFSDFADEVALHAGLVGAF